MKKVVSIMGICAMLGLAGCGEKTQVAENGDTVVINFAGYLDGVQFPGGTAENFPLKLGSGQFVPGFEEQVVGMNIGETKDVNVKFPENYQAEALKGKPAVFAVKLNGIQAGSFVKFHKLVIKLDI